ncbi:MAG: phage tail sheath subtilisin-like domain-containing protein [Planctomycetota bacterium]
MVSDIMAGSRVPAFHVRFNAQNAEQGPAIQTYRALIAGGRLLAGEVDELVPKRATSADEVGRMFGRGSVVHRMAIGWFENNRRTEAWFVGLDDPAGSNAASRTVTIAGAPTTSGTVFLYVAGTRLQVGAKTTDTPTTIGDAVVSAIAADDTLPVSAVNAAGTVTLTAKNKGELGNDVDVRVNYFPGEELPAGLTVTIGAMSGGTGAPDLDNLWAILGDEQYHVVAIPYTDAANLSSLDAELADRWGPERQIEGFATTAKAGTHSELTTFGDGQNSKHLACLGLAKPLTSIEQTAGALGAVVAAEGQADPARHFRTVELKGVRAPEFVDRFTVAEQDLLLRDGVATFEVDAGGTLRIQRLVTMHQENEAGAASTAFLDATTPLTLSFLRFDTRNRFGTKYPRYKLADDGTRAGAGQPIMTPSLAKAEMLDLFFGWQELGLVEGYEQFKRDLEVTRDPQDPNRLNFLVSPDLVNGFLVGAADFTFLV